MLSTHVVAANRTAIAAHPAAVPRVEVVRIAGFSLIPSSICSFYIGA